MRTPTKSWDGHTGTAGNQYADFKPRRQWRWELVTPGQKATTAGIRQEPLVNHISKEVRNWYKNALEGLTYRQRTEEGMDRSSGGRRCTCSKRNTQCTSFSAKI